MRIRIVLTDLDGTLLEPDGSLTDEAAAALRALAAAAVPVCPVTSKTAAELEGIMTRLGLAGLAGFENGAGILREDRGTELLEGAVPLTDLLSAFEAMRRDSGAPARSLLELGDDELGALTGLAGAGLAAARRRQATLPLVVESGWDGALRAALPAAPGLRLIRGNRFLHLQGRHTKATAASRVAELAGGREGATVALGDAPNDADMLRAAEVAVIVPGAGGPNRELMRVVPTARVAPEAHGRGWAAAVAALLAAPSARDTRGAGGAAGDLRGRQ